MAVTSTTLNGAITQGATQVTLTAFTNPSSGGIGARTLLRVDSELMLVTDASLSPTLQVARGYNGTPAVAHNTLAPVAYGLTSDLVTVNTLPTLASYSVNGAITIPTSYQSIVLNKATAAAMTLAAPGGDQNGLNLIITSTTNAAHTVTATSLFDNGGTGVPYSTATFTAFAGASMEIQAQKGLWNVLNVDNVTLT